MKDKMFYTIDGVTLNIYQIVEWTEYVDSVQICLANNTSYWIYRNSDPMGYDTLIKALKNRTARWGEG